MKYIIKWHPEFEAALDWYKDNPAEEYLSAGAKLEIIRQHKAGVIDKDSEVVVEEKQDD